MTLVLALLLVQSPATAEPRIVADSTRTADARVFAAARPRIPDGPPGTSQGQPGRSLLKAPFRLKEAPRVDPGVFREADAPDPGGLPRVVCTLRVVVADPLIDPAFVVRLPAPAPAPDPIVRDDLSRCVQ